MQAATSTFAPKFRGHLAIYAKVKELVAGLGTPAGKKVLDAPLGQGAMALHLHQTGYHVTGVDLDREQSKGLPADIVREQCNLNGPLPFPDATFDLAISLEGIEHVENHFHMLREFGRVTKSGGHLVISTPNICSIEERLKFLFRGTFYPYISREQIERRGSGSDHQNLISYLELRQVLNWAGFEVVRVEKDRVKAKQNFFLWPVYLLVKAYVAIQSTKRKEKYRLMETSSANVLLGGNTIIILARKGQS